MGFVWVQGSHKTMGSANFSHLSITSLLLPTIPQALSSADNVAPSPPSGVSMGYTGYAATQQQV